MIAASTCPHCGHDTALPELVDVNGITVGVELTCVRCDTLVYISHEHEHEWRRIETRDPAIRPEDENMMACACGVTRLIFPRP